MFKDLTIQSHWQVKTFSNAKSLMNHLYKHKPELLIMDVDLDEANGIELVQEIHARYPRLAVIFVSAHISFCSSVYEAEHIYFLPKPVDENNFKKAIAKAQQKIETTQDQLLTVKKRNYITSIRYEDIVYIENKGRKVLIQTIDSEIEAYMAIEELSETLDNRFVHCHKSYIVNMDFVKSKLKNVFILNDGTEIIISQSRRTQAKNAYLAYLGETL
jgi:DNA-binding LytR/AlgR family response regulator